MASRTDWRGPEGTVSHDFAYIEPVGAETETGTPAASHGDVSERLADQEGRERELADEASSPSVAPSSFSYTAASGGPRAVCAPLRDILSACHAGELAYRRAADRVHDEKVHAALLRYAHERARFAREIDTELCSLGAEPTNERDSGNQVVEGFAKDDTENVARCVASDEALRGAYLAATSAALPQDVEAVLARHRGAIEAAMATLGSLV